MKTDRQPRRRRPAGSAAYLQNRKGLMPVWPLPRISVPSTIMIAIDRKLAYYPKSQGVWQFCIFFSSVEQNVSEMQSTEKVLKRKGCSPPPPLPLFDQIVVRKFADERAPLPSCDGPHHLEPSREILQKAFSEMDRALVHRGAKSCLTLLDTKYTIYA